MSSKLIWRLIQSPSNTLYHRSTIVAGTMYIFFLLAVWGKKNCGIMIQAKTELFAIISVFEAGRFWISKKFLNYRFLRNTSHFFSNASFPDNLFEENRSSYLSKIVSAVLKRNCIFQTNFTSCCCSWNLKFLGPFSFFGNRSSTIEKNCKNLIT